MLASTADVQKFLPTDKLTLGTGAGQIVPDPYLLTAERVIRGQLLGTVSTAVLASWTTSNSTPQQIIEIAAMYAAAEIYAVRRSESSRDASSYATSLKNAALAFLAEVKSGNLTLIDSNNVEIPVTGSSEGVEGYPDDTALVHPEDAAFATMSQVWG